MGWNVLECSCMLSARRHRSFYELASKTPLGRKSSPFAGQWVLNADKQQKACTLMQTINKPSNWELFLLVKKKKKAELQDKQHFSDLQVEFTERDYLKSYQGTNGAC